MTRLLSLFGAVCCLLALAPGALAAQANADSVDCFSMEDFSGEQSITGICITDLPESGCLWLGDRVLRAGDVLTAQQAAQMTFAPGAVQTGSAQLGFLPIYEDRVAEAAAIGIRSKEDKAPIAEDMTLETYKNLPGTGKLKVSDPEGQALTFTVTRQPRRGSVTIAPDGTFTYTPKKNKVGIDSFTCTAADPAGHVSREATVTITILKPSDAAQYSDTMGNDCRFAAEWMRHTGIFTGESIAENPCFSPEKEVTRGEFVTMLVKALDIPTEEDLVYTGCTDEIPGWLQPYLAAAMRAGLTAGLPNNEVFGPDIPITWSEASVMLENALDLAYADTPAWAETGSPAENEVLTRAEAAMTLYQASRMIGKS